MQNLAAALLLVTSGLVTESPAPADAPAENAAEKAEKADKPAESPEMQAWKRCYAEVEGAASTEKNMRQGAETCERAAKMPGMEKRYVVESWLNVSRARLRVGDLLKGDAAVKEYELGRAAAQEARKLAPKNADAIFWDVAHLASIGKAKGVMKSLFMVPEIKEGLNAALAIDPNHHYARETLAKVYHELPGMVGGDDKLAESLLLEIVEKRDPNFTPAMVTLARLYIDQKRYADARRWLQKVIDMPTKQSSVPQDHWRFNLPDAKKELKRIEGKG